MNGNKESYDLIFGIGKPALAHLRCASTACSDSLIRLTGSLEATSLDGAKLLPPILLAFLKRMI